MEHMSANQDRTVEQPEILRTIYERARAADATIIIAESDDDRVTEAAKIIEREKLARLVLLNETSFQKMPPAEQDALAQAIAGLPMGDHLLVEAPADIKRRLATDTKYLAAALVKAGKADGYVSGNKSTTKETILTALKVIGTPDGYASSFFIMLHQGKPLFFADCGFNPNPNPEELARIAVDTARNVQALGIEPRVAFLSFSTAGSAEHEHVDEVREAIGHARLIAPDIAIAEDELQFDAAINPLIAAKKVSGGPVAGNANVFIFPDLNSGNIAYKVAREVGGAQAIGPIFQGFNAPANDLSRGCSTQDIVDVVAVTAMQAGALKKAEEEKTATE